MERTKFCETLCSKKALEFANSGDLIQHTYFTQDATNSTAKSSNQIKY